ncbi:uncharacterized protein TNCV_5053531 [Trichonephila clavipes]|nr:uncharacterized protein TNCV_5053531 [Trichonephila clavipes]
MQADAQTDAKPPVFNSQTSFVLIYQPTEGMKGKLDQTQSEAAYESRVEKTGYLLKRFTNQSSFLLLRKTGSAGQLGHVPLIETSDNPREQGLENKTGGVGLPISTFPSMS